MRDLMVALDRRGVACAALVHRHDWSLTNRDEVVGLNGRTFRVVRAGTWIRLLFTPISPAFPLLLRRMIRDLRPDILHLHLPNPSAFWALFLPSARRIPWIVHWHADVITAAQGWLMQVAYALYRPLERTVLKRSAAIIATSPPYLETSKPLHPWQPKCRVVPLGLDERRLSTGAAMANAPVASRANAEVIEPLQILAVGRLTYYKGFRYLLEALAQNANLHLTLAGEGDQLHELGQLAATLGVEQRARFHGTAKDAELARLLTDCDCLCLPSIERTEAFGMVLLEAMSFGKAVVVSDVPGSGMGWVVDHGVTGLKVPPADPKSLADALRELADDRDWMVEMGKAGKDKFERMFEIDHAVEGIVDAYRAVLASQQSESGS